jgi:hypothetical protein
MKRMLTRLRNPDTLAVLFLFALWLLFFWRLFTPIQADQASLTKGDFSGQFVAFAGYQYERLTQGEVPLWDPYNNGGLPFIADTQAAVFYPPRLATIALSKLAGGWSYHALELEMTFHMLACSLFLYSFVRRLTGSVFGGFVAAVVASYGGFLQGYPPLQLALLEAAIWLPLAALGILEATRGDRLRPAWLALTGLALGLSWMAGHPQTSFFLTYLLVGYLAFRVYERRWRWTVFVGGAILFGAMAGGLAAVQLLPGFEYLPRTARTGMGFDAKGNGFPFQDLVQFIIPHVVTVWSPLYVGLVGLTFALVALWRRVQEALFWGGAALVALLLSFGANSPFFALLYNLLPGLYFFRGQERAAYIVSFSLAILAGLGAAHAMTWDKLQDFKAARQIQRALLILFAVVLAAAGVVVALWLGAPDAYGKYVNWLAFSAAAAGLTLLLIPWLLGSPRDIKRLALVTGLMVFELFTVSMDARSNYDPVPPGQQLTLSPPPLVAKALEDKDIPFRVDGYRGLTDNYGSLYGLADMRGISPLFLEGPYNLLQGDLINPRAWELFAVRYVYTDWKELPVASDIIASSTDRYGEVNLHRLTDPRPFALLVYDIALAKDDAEARAILADANFNPRQRIVLNQMPAIPPQGGAGEGTASVTAFKPEQFMVQVNTPRNTILSLAQPDYPGWTATLDGQPTTLMRAYGAFTAVAVPAGEHTINLVYNPLSYRVGAIISLFTWAALAILGLVLLARNRVKLR